MLSFRPKRGWGPLAVFAVIVCAGLVYFFFSVISGGGSDHEIRHRLAGTLLKTAVTNDPVLVGAGDISSCAQDNDASTAKLLDGVVNGATGEVVVFTAGDNAYESGTDAEFQQCYDPTWGRYKDRTRPAPGNHEYQSGKADGYFKYFGEAIRRGVITATIWAPGTLSFSIPTTIASRSLARRGQRKKSGFAQTSRPTRRPALLRSGTTRASPQGRSTAIHHG